jgi:hypothetical protein
MLKEQIDDKKFEELLGSNPSKTQQKLVQQV